MDDCLCFNFKLRNRVVYAVFGVAGHFLTLEYLGTAEPTRTTRLVVTIFNLEKNINRIFTPL